MRTLEKHQFLMCPSELLKQSFGVGVTDHFIALCCQKHDPSVGVFIDLLQYIEFVGMDACFGLNIAADCHEEAGKQTMEETHAGAWHYFLRYFLADCFQVREWRVHNQQLTFLAEQSTDCSHTASPDRHFIIFASQKFDSQVHFLGFFLPQRYIIFFQSISTPSEVKTGQPDISRNMWQLRVPFVPTAGISVQVQDNVFCVGRGSVDREGKRDTVDCVFIPIFIFSSGVEQFLIVLKSGRPDQHVRVLLDAGVGDVPFHFEGAWFLGSFPVVSHSSYYN